jgi:hypothetical protein
MLIVNVFSSINWLAVVVMWIMHVVISLLWFQPFLFGKAWVKLSGKELNPAKKWIPVGFIAHLLCIIALAIIINLVNISTLLDGILAGILVSIGFISAMLAGELVWEKIAFKLFLIRLGDQIITLSIAGAILAVWR